MANSLITAQWVARKALVLLHAKSNFTGRTNRDYQSLLPGPINGVILGQQLSIRLPFQYTLRTGPQMNAQNSVQRFATLLVNQQLGVDINFTSVERAISSCNGASRGRHRELHHGSGQQRAEVHGRFQHHGNLRSAAPERAVPDGSLGAGRRPSHLYGDPANLAVLRA